MDSCAEPSPLTDRAWRLRNLYWIKDKDGRRIRFVPNWAQQRAFDSLSSNNLELKVRQLGITTGYCMLWLDTCLFSPDVAVGVIAHTKEDAKVIFRDKIKFAYDNLPADLRAAVPAVKQTESEIIFGNGSSIRVGLTFRSGTVQVLHVTEYGYICAHYPRRAQEIRTGAFEAVPKSGIKIIESTARGRAGHFYDLCRLAQQRRSDAPLQHGDWRFSFLPWWEHPEYSIDEPAFVFTEAELRHFTDTETLIGRQLSRGQRCWYARKWRDQGDDVRAEYPSTPEEAFQQSTEGAYYGSPLLEAYRAGRVCELPWDRGLEVETWWDLGVDDSTAIWFLQRQGQQLRVVDYYENSGEGLSHYRGILEQRAQQHGIVYSRHIGPHDLKVRELGNDAKSRLQAAAELGIRFEVAPMLKVADGIEAVRRLLPHCWFDESRTAPGRKALEHYRKEWDAVRGCWKDQPLHDWSSHAADAFRVGAVAGDARLNTRNTRARPIQPARWR
ncbi:terminase [Solimonas sp. K1W22B-7]|uniref:terminase n=1 Tax=Solimonas sp. K1W22B-7 TaxID=2303331 RepID=UPI000E335517|nr:terminase [Solimonas sp. K1W22B-7]AXQ30469.1 terminase [Solimonas sp. K1W22B-7]